MRFLQLFLENSFSDDMITPFLHLRRVHKDLEGENP